MTYKSAEETAINPGIRGKQHTASLISLDLPSAFQHQSGERRCWQSAVPRLKRLRSAAACHWGRLVCLSQSPTSPACQPTWSARISQRNT